LQLLLQSRQPSFRAGTLRKCAGGTFLVQVCKMQEHFGIRRKPVKGFNNRSRKEQKNTECIFALGQTTDKVNVGGHFFFKKALKSK